MREGYCPSPEFLQRTFCYLGRVAAQALHARVLKLERRIRLLRGIVRLLFAVLRLFGFRLDSQRVPSVCLCLLDSGESRDQALHVWSWPCPWCLLRVAAAVERGDIGPCIEELRFCGKGDLT